MATPSVCYLLEVTEDMTIAELVIGKEASSFNTVDGDVACFNFSRSEDNVKEGLEVFVLSLKSMDVGVCPCRDYSLVHIPPNGGTYVT